MEPEFQPYGLPHLTVIFLTIVLPFVLAAIVWRTKSLRAEKVIVGVLSAVLVLNYVVYLIFIRSLAITTWQQLLPARDGAAAGKRQIDDVVQNKEWRAKAEE